MGTKIGSSDLNIRLKTPRKVRIEAANFHGIPELLPFLNPLRGFVAFALWSRKIIRWFVLFLRFLNSKSKRLIRVCTRLPPSKTSELSILPMCGGPFRSLRMHL